MWVTYPMIRCMIVPLAYYTTGAVTNNAIPYQKTLPSGGCLSHTTPQVDQLPSSKGGRILTKTGTVKPPIIPQGWK